MQHLLVCLRDPYPPGRRGERICHYFRHPPCLIIQRRPVNGSDGIERGRLTLGLCAGAGCIRGRLAKIGVETSVHIPGWRGIIQEQSLDRDGEPGFLLNLAPQTLLGRFIVFTPAARSEPVGPSTGVLAMLDEQDLTVVGIAA